MIGKFLSKDRILIDFSIKGNVIFHVGTYAWKDIPEVTLLVMAFNRVILSKSIMEAR